MRTSIALEGFILDLSSQGYSPYTIRTHKYYLALLIKRLEDQEVNSITAEDLKRFVIWVRDEYKPKPIGKMPRSGSLSMASVDNLIKAIKSFFGWLSRLNYIDNRPDLDIKFPRYITPEIQPFTQNHLQSLIKACPMAGSRKRRTVLRDILIILLLIDTGIRVGELVRLRVCDLNLQTAEIYVRPYLSSVKSRPRTIPIGVSCKRAAWRYLQSRQLHPDDPLLTTATGAAITANQVRNLLDDIGRAAGVPDVFPHRFRHTFAIEFLRNGGDVFSLQRLLGHNSLDQTKKYVAWAKCDIESAHRRASPADHWKL